MQGCEKRAYGEMKEGEGQRKEREERRERRGGTGRHGGREGGKERGEIEKRKAEGGREADIC